MMHSAIRIPEMRGSKRESDLWLARAAQARRIAAILSKLDAEIALAHAAECEAEAARLLRPVHPPIAA